MSSSANTAKERSTQAKPVATAAAPAKQKQKPKSTQMVSISDAEDDSSSASASRSSSEEDDYEEEEEEEEETSGSTSESDDKYDPPTPFLRLPPPSPSSRNPFSSGNLAGKELWLISAPASAPLSKLGSVNAADVLDNAQVLGTSSGRMFSVRETDDCGVGVAGGLQVLVHDGRGGYRFAGKEITKSVQFFETLPGRSGASAAGEKRGRAAKSVRAQPDGLKMRFKPMGYVGDQDEDGMPGAVVDGGVSGPVRKKKRRESAEGGVKIKAEKAEHSRERKHKSKKSRKEREVLS